MAIINDRSKGRMVHTDGSQIPDGWKPDTSWAGVITSPRSAYKRADSRSDTSNAAERRKALYDKYKGDSAY